MSTTGPVRRQRSIWHRLIAASPPLLIAVLAAATAPACVNSQAALTDTVQARRVAAGLEVEFTKAVEAANRAVMADTDAASTAAAEDARRSRQNAERDVEALQRLLESLGYRDDLRFLQGFKARFDEYRRLDDEILPLAVENTNVKAQRLSSGPAREAAEQFRRSLDAAVRTSTAKDGWRDEALAARARIALLEIQALHATHIAEASDAAMTRLEGQMTGFAVDARAALGQLKVVLPRAAETDLAAANAALNRFMSIHGEIVALSRRNSDVRSLAMSLGRKRTVTAACEDQLQALEHALAKHEFIATR